MAVVIGGTPVGAGHPVYVIAEMTHCMPLDRHGQRTVGFKVERTVGGVDGTLKILGRLW